MVLSELYEQSVSTAMFSLKLFCVVVGGVACITGSVLACRATCLCCGKSGKRANQDYVAYMPNASQIPPPRDDLGAVHIPIQGNPFLHSDPIASIIVYYCALNSRPPAPV